MASRIEAARPAPWIFVEGRRARRNFKLLPDVARAGS
jgi:hypothetical protein